MSDWRPVSDLPPELKTVLVFVPGSEISPGTKEDFDSWHIAFLKNGHFKLQDDNLYVEPTHWAELTVPEMKR